MELGIRNILPRLPAEALWSRLRSICDPYINQAREALIPYWRQSVEWYDKREPREKLLLRLLGCIVIALFFYNIIYIPAHEWRDGLAQRVIIRQHELVRLRGMMRNFDRLRMQLASTQKRTVAGGKDPALFSVVEMILTNSVGRSKIGSITPSEHQVPGGFQQYAVDVKLNQIALREIVNSLYSLESLNVPITISNLRIHQHAGDSHSYDVDLTCVALSKTGS